MKTVCVFDIESDGLLNSATKIHCLSYKIGDNPILTTNDPKKIKDIFSRNYTFIGHNIVLYDFRVLEKLLGIKMPNSFIDTLMLSWYLFPKAPEHGLEWWGSYFKYPKVAISDWSSLSYEDYKGRCERDVEINNLLWVKEINLLNKLYDNNPEKIIKYLMFKIYSIKIQHENPIKLDIPFIKDNLDKLNAIYKEKKEKLESILPKIPKYGSVTYKNYIEIDGKYFTKKDIEYEDLVKEGHEIKEKITLPKILREDLPNGNSQTQIKDYLFSIGWKPLWYKKSTLKSGKISKSPQISKENGNSGEICDSVVALYEEHPELEALESMGVLKHRIGILKGFLRDQVDGYIVADIAGITNTLRIRHKGVVNLVGYGKPYWDIIRGCFICEDDEIMCGSDLSGLETSTQHHYMYNYDTEYVNKIRQPGYDPHISLGVLGGIISEDEAIEYKKVEKGEIESNKRYKETKKKRQVSKQANFALTYGAFPPKIAEATKLPLKQAEKLFNAYWELNKSIKQAASDFKIKKVNNQDWVLNPISDFWLSLRNEKDIFNTINQSSGVYTFDTWRKIMMHKGLKIRLEMHDEILTVVKISEREKVKKIIEDSIKELNILLNLNVQIKNDTKFGKRYSECH